MSPPCVAQSLEPSAAPILCPPPPKKVMRAVGDAIRDWKMIEDVSPTRPLPPHPSILFTLLLSTPSHFSLLPSLQGDRLCLGLSGGKDSLSLLHILLDIQKRAPVRFTIAAATVDPQTSSFDPKPLIPYMKRLGVPYHFLAEPIIESAKVRLPHNTHDYCSHWQTRTWGPITMSH